LGVDDGLAAERSQGRAPQLLVRERAVHLGGVEERHAALHGRPEERDHLLPVSRRTVREVQPHAAEPESRNFEAAASQLALLHFSSYDCSREAAAYSSSLTFSIHSTVLPPCCSTMAMCVMAVVSVAPCQCFSPGGHQITSPGRICSTGPPQLCTRPQPAVTL